MRQLFELLQPIQTDLDGFLVTLVVAGRDTVLSTIFSQLLSTDAGGVTIRLALIAPWRGAFLACVSSTLLAPIGVMVSNGT
jgi:hypothetical protein